MMPDDPFLWPDYDLPGIIQEDPDATYYDWYGDPIMFAGDETRHDLEYDSSGRRVPKRSFPEKIIEAVLATPSSALITGLFVLAILFSMKVK